MARSRAIARLRADFGASVFDAQPVRATFARDFPATIELSLAAMIVAIALSLVLLGVSIPVFGLGWVLVHVCAVLPALYGVDLFPISGRLSLSDAVPLRTHLVVLDAVLAGRPLAALDALRHLELPALALGTIPLAIVAKGMRAAIIDTLGSDCVRTARAKGLSERAVVFGHALLPILTVLGLQTWLLPGGAGLTESLFGRPGVGRLAFDAIANRDMPLVNGCLLLFAVVFVIVCTGVDVLYAASDPRVRYR